jgi:hypothetical protein
MFITAYPLERARSGVVDHLVEERVVPRPTGSSGHSGMFRQVVGGIRRLLVPATALSDQPGPEVDEAIV